MTKRETTATKRSLSSAECTEGLRRPIHEPPGRLVLEPFVSTKHVNTTTPADSGDPTDVALGAQATIPEDGCCNAKAIVYMLHGWAQNVHVFSNRTRKLTKRLTKAGYRVIFLQAPHRLPPLASTTGQPSVGSREYAYGWFLYDGDANPETLQPSPTGTFRGMLESLDYLRTEFQSDKETFGSTPMALLGFSQGAVLVHKIATLACNSSSSIEKEDRIGFRWSEIQNCILVSGVSFRASFGLGENCERTMPSFHVLGTRDRRVNPSLTMELYSLEPCFGCREKILWEHDRGHVVPQDRSFCASLLEFLARKQEFP